MHLRNLLEGDTASIYKRSTSHTLFGFGLTPFDSSGGDHSMTLFRPPPSLLVLQASHSSDEFWRTFEEAFRSLNHLPVFPLEQFFVVKIFHCHVPRESPPPD